jgi:hypothetical protein
MIESSNLPRVRGEIVVTFMAEAKEGAVGLPKRFSTRLVLSIPPS